MFLVITAQKKFWGWRGHGCAHINEIKLRVITWRHPGTYMPALFPVQIPPAVILIAGGTLDSMKFPDFFPGVSIVGGNEAGIRSCRGQTVSARYRHAVYDYWSIALLRGMSTIIKNTGFPFHRARVDIEGNDIVIIAGINNGLVMDGNITHCGICTNVITKVLGHFPLVFPKHVTAHRVKCLYYISRVR